MNLSAYCISPFLSLFVRNWGAASLRVRASTYRSTGNEHFHLSFCGAHQSAEFVTHALEQAEAVVLGQDGEEVLDCAGLVGAAGVLFEFGDDLGLVGVGECGRVEDGLEFGVGFDDLE
jgi:hypothetical protein